jgi:hypothetical protein
VKSRIVHRLLLSRAARRARVELRFDAGKAGLVPQEGGIDGALGRIAAAVDDTMADGNVGAA